MASGDSLLLLKAPFGQPTETVYATLDTILGASTPKELIPVYDFDAAADEYVDFPLVMPQNYAGTTGITCTVRVSASTATSSNFRVAIALRNMETTDDLDTTSHTYVYNEVSIAVPGTVGLSAEGVITFTDGADMDSVAAGDYVNIRIYRNQGHGDDLASGDMELHFVDIKET